VPAGQVATFVAERRLRLVLRIARPGYLPARRAAASWSQRWSCGYPTSDETMGGARTIRAHPPQLAQLADSL
jgi:hypothetical protein